MKDEQRGSRVMPGYFLLLQTPSPSLYLAGEATRLSETFTGNVPGRGSCWWSAPGDLAFSFLKHASPSGLWGKYHLSILASHLLTLESPGNM